MKEIKPSQPEQRDNTDVSPCTVAYHFSILDIEKGIRFCCHGEKKAVPFDESSEYWDSEVFEKFRTYWHENFHKKKGLCLGCPHHEENNQYREIIEAYLKEHN